MQQNIIFVGNACDFDRFMFIIDMRNLTDMNLRHILCIWEMTTWKYYICAGDNLYRKSPKEYAVFFFFCLALVLLIYLSIVLVGGHQPMIARRW